MPGFHDDENLPPSTPDRHGTSNFFNFSNPSTTPAGPPPSSAASYTPAGAPSASYLGSSIMRGVTGQKPVNPIKFGNRSSGGIPKKNFLTRGTRSPLGRSVTSTKERQPSRLSRQVAMDDYEDEDEEDEDEEDEEDYEGEDTQQLPTARSFGLEYSDDDEDEEEDDGDEGEHAEGDDTDYVDRHYARMNQFQGRGNDTAVRDSARDDMWMSMGQNGTPQHAGIGDESDLMELMTPAINDRVRREAEGIFRASAMRSNGRAARELNFAPVAKSLAEQMGYAELTEPPLLVLETDGLVSQLYTEGVGSEDDVEKLDAALARTSSHLVSLWSEYVAGLPQNEQEHIAGIGPGPNAAPFENAAYLAGLALQVHHTRSLESDESQPIPLPEVLFQWLGENHNLYPDQTKDISTYRPSPACHTLFWQTVFMNILQGRVADALNLLRNGGFDQVKKGSGFAYTGQALSNVLRAIHETCVILEACPGIDNDWDLWNSDWTLFRVRAKGALDALRRFAEGKEKSLGASDFSDSGRGSMAGMARKAESQVPWDIYENINIIFDIILGSQERIVQVSQDWCEATVAMFGWWDEGRDLNSKNDMRMSQSLSLSRSRMLVPAAPRIANSEDYLDRLARSFQGAVSSGLEVNSNSALEVGMACVFEDNPKGLIGILRSWSLPVAAAVAEIATLGGWLPAHQPVSVFGALDLDINDLEVLGLDPRGPDELDGMKDNTLVQYAQALVNLDQLSLISTKSGTTMDGWELAIHVLGRMDSSERSEDTIGELVKTLLADVDANAGPVVDKVWRLLNNLGMIEFAEETAEHFGDALARESHSYGQAMWYYSLAHRPNKVREVMNLLISYSLLQSTVFPPESELDEHLRQLVHDRNETLAEFAKQDLEAAELLGKMLSGYATLRRFYEIRDDDTTAVPLHRRRAAAADALMAVIAASDDNIRGGLYDPSRDGLVSEDFLLTLLGEATALVDTSAGKGPVIEPGAKTAITLDHIDTLLKAAEDLAAIKSTSVYTTCDEFFKLTLASMPGLKGSNPMDLMRKSTVGGHGSTSSSYVLGGSSLIASQLSRSMSSSSLANKAAISNKGWDWRSGFNANSRADDLLKRLRLGVARDLARLWVEEADSGFM
ncbi:hypothetical protein MCOR34_001902 [Pyricularia oryzae]|nr:hypothetical protein MCOR34_001902 [Pyricularia oryzae]KAI6457846.1 hypothetical protein MCOR17_007647 [Pyricularia oryzae]